MTKTRCEPSVIPSIDDKFAIEANMAAIGRLIPATKYVHIITLDKWLGFTHENVQRHIADAEAEGSPLIAIQKNDGK